MTRVATFQGTVTAVVGPAANPSAFTVMNRLGRLLVFRVVPSTRFHALSAEAAVQGFVGGDYAAVVAVRVSRDWVAANISYDVTPPPQLRSFSGVVERVAPDGAHFLVKLDSGMNRWFPVPPNVKIKFNGDPATPDAIARGRGVIVVLQKTDREWVVIEIDITPTHAQFTDRAIAN